MASKRTSPTKRSSNPKTGEHPKQEPFADKKPSRAHRADTPEAKRQRERTPKTHPTRAVSSARKDKPRPTEGRAGSVRRTGRTRKS